ncbi:hypothetical protein U9M48_021687 [Paspalum notatum var. saurae]|uniref:Uncharacterized protein n=1 Tax=Paspalum notatum var. saurae TaxID=547442 RepID=A0AAQ3WU12_PASNO
MKSMVYEALTGIVDFAFQRPDHSFLLDLVLEQELQYYKSLESHPPRELSKKSTRGGRSTSCFDEAKLATNFENLSPKCWEAYMKGLSIDVLLLTNSMEPPTSQVISQIPTKGQPVLINCFS